MDNNKPIPPLRTVLQNFLNHVAGMEGAGGARLEGGAAPRPMGAEPEDPYQREFQVICDEILKETRFKCKH